MKAIQTRILPATNTKPTRIKAWAEKVPARIWCRDALQYEQQHTAGADRLTLHEFAARKYADQNEWSTRLVSGGLPNGDWCHCFVPDVVVETLKLADILFDVVSCSDRFDGLKDSVKKSLKAL